MDDLTAKTPASSDAHVTAADEAESVLTTTLTPTSMAVPGRTAPAIDRPRRATQHRDRFVDVLRVFAILLVVAQHWLMPVLSYDDGQITTGNALSTGSAWVITWFSQVMPLVFFAGGAAAAISLRRRWRRHGRSRATSAAWLGDRLRRLAWPVLPLAAVWLPLPPVLAGLGLPVQPVAIAARLAGQLLWFLAAYVVLMMLTTALVRLHERWRGKEIAVLAGCAVAVDVVRFGWLDGADAIGYANVIFVWATVFQVGVVYAGGGLDWLRGRTALKVSAAGFVVTAVAVLVTPYPLSMIGMPGVPLSNMNPPTAVLLAVAAGQLALALALRPAIQRWSASAPVAHGVQWLSRRMMTVYLWHMPALVVVAGIAVVGFGYETPAPFSEPWRDQMPVWLLGLSVVLAGLVHIFGRFEHPRAPTIAPAPWRVGLATPLIGLGLLTMTALGFAPVDGATLRLDAPLLAFFAVVLGTALLQKHRITGSSTLGEHGRLEV